MSTHPLIVQVGDAFQIEHIRAGDVVFVYSAPVGPWSAIKRFVNTNGQRALAAIRRRERITLSRRVPKFSHVMLGMDSGLVVHADGKSVNIEIISDALYHATEKPSQFEIYRLCDLPEEVGKKIVAAANRYFAKRYSFATYFSNSEPAKPRSREDTTQFCSRLVAHAYRSAGIALTNLPDNKVLPVDLYIVCQTQNWQNVSGEFIQEPTPPELDEAMGTINVPGRGEIPFSEFMRNCDELMRRMAELVKQSKESQYTVTRHMLYTEALLAKLVGALFDHAKLLWIAPEILEDTFAPRIARVLQQLNTLLGMSLLLSIDDVISDSMINKMEGRNDLGLYAGFPAPLTVREMQKDREAVTVYAYLLLAEIGLCSILAHRTPHDTFAKFRQVKPEYVEQFLAALGPVCDLSAYRDNQNLFKWIENDDDRKTSQKTVHNIVRCLDVIQILRNSKGAATC